MTATSRNFNFWLLCDIFFDTSLQNSLTWRGQGLFWLEYFLLYPSMNSRRISWSIGWEIPFVTKHGKPCVFKFMLEKSSYKISWAAEKVSETRTPPGDQDRHDLIWKRHSVPMSFGIKTVSNNQCGLVGTVLLVHRRWPSEACRACSWEHQRRHFTLPPCTRPPDHDTHDIYNLILKPHSVPTSLVVQDQRCTERPVRFSLYRAFSL